MTVPLGLTLADVEVHNIAHYIVTVAQMLGEQNGNAKLKRLNFETAKSWIIQHKDKVLSWYNNRLVEKIEEFILQMVRSCPSRRQAKKQRSRK